MKAIIRHNYGSPDVLKLEEVEKPNVGDDEVLVRVHAASVNPLDWYSLTGKPYLARIGDGLLKPKRQIPGIDMAGRIEAVGRNITQFKPGDEVFGGGRGAYAEYACVKEDHLAPKPANITFEQAAAVPIAAFTALQGLRDTGKIQAEQKILINGASGGVGSFAVQIAKSFGAEVTAVCSSRNVDRVRSIGADQIIDYSQADFTQSKQRYDLILDTVGNRSLLDCRRVLKSNGIYVSVGGPKTSFGVLTHIFKMLFTSLFVSQKMSLMLAKQSKKDLVILAELIEAGKIAPLIDRQYKLSEAPEALRHVGEGHTQGKVVITINT